MKNKNKLLVSLIIYILNAPILALATENFYQKIEAITGGAYHNLILYSDGSVWAYGNGAYGQLGNGEIQSHSLPVRVLIDIPIIQIAAGEKHSLILGADGKVYAFGSNKWGQIDSNNPTSIYTIPTPISNLPSDINIIADGGNHSLALKSDHSVWAWGKNDYGQCGRSPTDALGVRCRSNEQTLPVKVKRLPIISKIAAGHFHTIALDENGLIWGFGRNDSGQLGDGSFIKRCPPVKALCVNESNLALDCY